MSEPRTSAAAEPAAHDGKPLVAVPVKVVLAVAALAVVALISYGIGTQHGAPRAHVLSGRAYVGAAIASVKVDGWAYGLDIAPGMQWYDARGELHDGGVPPCLQGAPGHYAWIRFGYSVAYGLHGESWRPVDWVQCLTRRP